MGLMLSVLITCVGVAELLAFYTNVRRRLVMPLHPSVPPPPPRLQQHEHHMSGVTQTYLKELGRERNRLLNEIRRLEGAQRRSSVTPDAAHASHLKSLADAQHVTLHNATDISHGRVGEDYQPEDTPPLGFPDKRIPHVFPSYSDGGNKPVINLHRPSLEETPIIFDDSAYESSQDIYEAHDEEHREREASPFPTYARMAPRGSICSELIVNPTVSVDEVDEEGYRSQSQSSSTNEQNTNKTDEFLKSQFDSKEYWKHKSKSHSRTPEILRENLLEFEKKSRSRSPSPCVPPPPQKQEEDTTTKKSTETPKTSTSHSSGEPSDIYKATGSIDPEPSGVTLTELPPHDDAVGVEKDLLQTVDGKLTPHEEHKRTFKNKKQRKNKKPPSERELELEQQRLERQSDYGSYSSSSSVIGVEEHALDGAQFREVELEEVQDAGPSSSKQGEPFWVKKC